MACLQLPTQQMWLHGPMRIQIKLTLMDGKYDAYSQKTFHHSPNQKNKTTMSQISLASWSMDRFKGKMKPDPPVYFELENQWNIYTLW